MKTFTEPKVLVANPAYADERQATLADLDTAGLDRPLVDLVLGFAELPWCFPVQSCYGHFLWTEGQGRSNLDRLPPPDKAPFRVLYRLAYFVLCLDHSPDAQHLLRGLRALPAISPDRIQFGAADWFWERQVNTVVLQVEPWQHRQVDSVMLTYDEACLIEESRDWFFLRLGELLREQKERLAAS